MAKLRCSLPGARLSASTPAASSPSCSARQRAERSATEALSSTAAAAAWGPLPGYGGGQSATHNATQAWVRNAWPTVGSNASPSRGCAKQFAKHCSASMQWVGGGAEAPPVSEPRPDERAASKSNSKASCAPASDPPSAFAAASLLDKSSNGTRTPAPWAPPAAAVRNSRASAATCRTRAARPTPCLHASQRAPKASSSSELAPKDLRASKPCCRIFATSSFSGMTYGSECSAVGNLDASASSFGSAALAVRVVRARTFLCSAPRPTSAAGKCSNCTPSACNSRTPGAETDAQAATSGAAFMSTEAKTKPAGCASESSRMASA
mmetsp:Transcript_91376/g.295503  ORF Transcript_91376/g.295503 Transcript_91376/m.295503 type:complete len:323 (+) Transcript_91376:342-1310(+)